MEIAVFALVPILAVLAAATWVIWQVMRGLYWGLGHLAKALTGVAGRAGGFLKTEFVEAVHVAGGVLTAAVLLPLAGINLLIGRWKTGRHYGGALEDELAGAALGVYRIALAHPLRFVGLGALLEGLERRVPDVMDRAPRSVPRGAGKAGPIEFEGYEVISPLPPGGSGALLYLARPRAETLARAVAGGLDMPHEVVIKSFALVTGSTLPQIVRESRALEAAKRLGLVLEHHLSEDHFYYVMRYVRGEELDTVVQRMHAQSGPEGLRDSDLASALSYAQDMLENLDHFHQGGLWHKDVKPANLIVSEERVQLVDFGLVTPLQSALTLTTHGTEYYRDPEMVRLAMQGVKVHEVDGVKFDLYSAGAVLFTMIENSFPAHGSLSSISKRCPEALAWIVRRAMADIDSRYRAAWEMLEDLKAVARSEDAFALRPADLPSVLRGDSSERPRGSEGSIASRLFGRTPPAVAPRAYVASTNEKRGSNTRRRRRGRGGRTVVVALIGLAVASVVGVFDDHGHQERTSQVTLLGPRAAAEAMDLYDFEREALLAGTEALAAVTGEDEVSRLRGLWDTHLATQLPDLGEPRLDRAALRRSAPVLPDGGAGEVLILEARSLRGRDFEGPTLGALREALETRGFEIIEDRESEAGARHAVGLGGLEDPEAHDRLQRYLDGGTELDAIIWIAAGEDGVPQYRVLVRRDLSDSAPRMLR